MGVDLMGVSVNVAFVLVLAANPLRHASKKTH